MNLQQILNAKGSNVYTTPPTASLTEAVSKLVQNRCGSLVVCIGDEMVGIISERDILRACDSGNCSLVEMQVERGGWFAAPEGGAGAGIVGANRSAYGR